MTRPLPKRELACGERVTDWETRPRGRLREGRPTAPALPTYLRGHKDVLGLQDREEGDSVLTFTRGLPSTGA